ncbi:MAG: hypothetical protein II114_05890 [Treponema sp.]|nr:hypothetical protein [Treponema sp.]MBQ2530288.1 hypothetical protein [Treponema sp.]MBQ4235578.1 hypothetical protein [Treponema sp.]MBQ5384207.1 hypothetical protein [Treponema sp.]
MSYKIAVATSDGENVDLHFGAADAFSIYEVSDEGKISFLEKRSASDQISGAEKKGSCGQNVGCGSGSSCGCGGEVSEKVLLLDDCRCVVCEKIGFNVTKQLEKKAVASFDVDCPVQVALEKISNYFHSVDNHISLARR